jgi:hypothetical protein
MIKKELTTKCVLREGGRREKERRKEGEEGEERRQGGRGRGEGFEGLFSIALQIKGLIDIFTEDDKTTKFRKFLEHVLAVGNYVNFNGRAGNAPGFRLLSALEQIKTFKANDGQSLLFWILENISQEYSYLHEWVRGEE